MDGKNGLLRYFISVYLKQFKPSWRYIKERKDILMLYMKNVCNFVRKLQWVHKILKAISILQRTNPYVEQCIAETEEKKLQYIVLEIQFWSAKCMVVKFCKNFKQLFICNQAIQADYNVLM